MNKFDEARIASYLSLIFSGYLAADGGYYPNLLFVLVSFGVSHIIGRFIVIRQAQAFPLKILPRWRFVLYCLLIIAGPWIGLMLCMLP